MSNSCKKYYDYVMCLLVLINPRYISYYMIYHVYTIPIGIFFHQQTSLFLGAPSVQRRQVMSGAAQVEQQHKDWNSDDEDMAIGSDAMKP